MVVLGAEMLSDTGIKSVIWTYGISVHTNIAHGVHEVHVIAAKNIPMADFRQNIFEDYSHLDIFAFLHYVSNHIKR